MPRASIPAAPHSTRSSAPRAEGHRAFKLKIGFGEETDLGSLRPVASASRSGERLMVDVNQGWDLAAACAMAPKLAEFGLGWIEEPLMADRPLAEWTQVAAAAPCAVWRPARMCAAQARSRR